MERLLHSPGRTRDEHRYQTARPSSQLISRSAFTYGTATPLRGHDIGSDFGAKSADSLDFANKLAGAMPLRKVSEKELLQGLNDRFAGFIEKVHHLENQNRALEREIDGIRLKAKSSAPLSKEYESELTDLRRQVQEMTLQKHQIEINRQNLEDEFNTLRDKYVRETHGRVDAEDNITVLKKCISDVYLAKQEMDRKAKALEDEISFLKANHESEVAEMMVQMQDSQVKAEQRDFSRSDLTAALRDIRMKLEGHTASDTRYAEERFRAQLAKLTKAAEVDREAIMVTKAQIQDHRRQLQSKNIELDSVKGVREALEKQLYDLEQRHNAEIHHYQDTIRELEFELKNAKYDMSSHLREYQDLLNVKMGLDAEIYSYRKLLEGEESRYSIISDAHITVPYIYRQSPIYTLPCVTRQGGGRRAEPQYKFVEEIITETTREDVEISDTGSEKSMEGDRPEESGEKDTDGDISQEVKDEEPEADVVDSEGGNPDVETEENKGKPTEERDDVGEKPVENMTDSEAHQDMDTDSKPTQEILTTEEKDKDEEVDTKDLKDDMNREAEIAQSDVTREEDVKNTEGPVKEAEKDVPKPDLSKELSEVKAEKCDETGPEEKTSQEPQNAETTAQVNNKPSEQVIEVPSKGSEDDGHKDATVTSWESKTASDKEKETTPVKSEDVNAPTLNPKPAPENAEDGQKTTSGKEEDQSKNKSSPKQEISETEKQEPKQSELVEKDKEDTGKITEAEKPIEKNKIKEEKPQESAKEEDGKADGLIGRVKTTKEENVKSNTAEKTQEELSKPELKQDSQHSNVDGVNTSEGQTKVTDKKVDETQSNEAPKATEPKPDAELVEMDTQESKEKMPEKVKEAVKTEEPQKDVKSDPNDSKQADSSTHEVKATVSDTATKPETKALEKTEQVKESSMEDSVSKKGPGETGKAL